MAIQVNGTTVIDDSRNLSNVGGLKTVGGTSILGSGNIATGGSTTYGDVGTYIIGRPENYVQYTTGDTASGLVAVGNSGATNQNAYNYNTTWYNGFTSSTSGTWRCMSPARTANGGIWGMVGLWVRIS